MLEESRYSIASNQVRDLRQRFLSFLDEVQSSISPRFLDMRRYFSESIKDFQKQLDFVFIYDWDFDHYLEEDIPIAVGFLLPFFEVYLCILESLLITTLCCLCRLSI